MLNIIPLNIQQFSDLLSVVIELKRQNRRFRHNQLKELYDNILDIPEYRTSQEWVDAIPEKIENWKLECVR